MRGLPDSVLETDNNLSVTEKSRKIDAGTPRTEDRGFFDASDENPDGSKRIIWSLPPVYPFDYDDPTENSGFVM